MDREQMIEAFGLVADGGIQFDPYNDEGKPHRYIDWSIVSHDGQRAIEVGDGYGVVNFEVTRAEMIALHAALTATLLTDER